MIQTTFLCFEEDCKANSRLIQDYKEITKNGQHSKHEFENLIDLQVQIEEKDFSSNSVSIDTMITSVDEFCYQLQQNNVSLIDSFASAQKIRINKLTEPSSEYNECKILVKAILDGDLKVLQEKQKFLPLLKETDQILENQRLQTSQFELQMTQQNEILSQRLRTIFNMDHQANHSLLKENEIKEQEQQSFHSIEELNTQKEQSVIKQDELEAKNKIIKDLQDQISFQLEVNQKYNNLDLKDNAQIKNIKDLQDQLLKQKQQNQKEYNVLEVKHKNQTINLIQLQTLLSDKKKQDKNYDEMEVKYKAQTDCWKKIIKDLQDELTDYKKVHQNYEQSEVKYNEQTKNIQILRNLLTDEQNKSNILNQKLFKIQNQMNMEKEQNTQKHNAQKQNAQRQNAQKQNAQKQNAQKQNTQQPKFTWSTINKNAQIQISEQKIKCQIDNIHGSSVLLDPKMNMNTVMKVQIKINSLHKSQEVALIDIPIIFICDVKVIKQTCPNFSSIHASKSQISHRFDGISWIQGLVTSGGGLTFGEGDTLELQWNGPQKQFTIINLKSTELTQTFNICFKKAAEIHFGITFCDKNSYMQII